MDGDFSLEVQNSSSILLFSFIGYESQEVTVGSQVNLEITLKSDVTKLDEVVVVGYGTTKSKDLTGSVATVGTENFNKGVIASPDQLFQGRTAGVNITPTSGEPGSSVTVNIRGTSSIRGSNDPLFVIDGIPMDTEKGIERPLDGGYGGNVTSPRSPLSFLNPDDIESITILKDASSAAIYGSRGANGVVLITTKNGKTGSPHGKFTYSAFYGVSTPAKNFDMLNASEFLAAVKKSNMDAGASEQNAQKAIEAGTVLNQGGDTDWQREIFRKGASTGHNLTWGMSGKKTTIHASGSYYNQQGIIKTSGITRFTGRVNLTQKIGDKFKIDLSTTISRVENSFSPRVFEFALQSNPTYPVYRSDGGFLGQGGFLKNPVEMLNYITSTDNERRFLFNISGSYQIMPELAFKSTCGYNNANTLLKTFGDPRLNASSFGGSLTEFGVGLPGSTAPGNGRAVYQHQKYTSLLTEQTLTYEKKLGKDAVNAVIGYSYQNFTTANSAEAGYKLRTSVVNPADPFIKDINNFVNIQTVDPLPSYTIVDLQSFFGRVNYTIGSKYYVTATARVDGSSKFGEGNKYGTFPAFAVKWRLSNEKFMTALSKVLYELSVRGNWGRLGSQDGLGAYDAVDYSTRWKGQTRLEHQGNKNLKWELATTTGVGLDWAIAGNRLSGTVDYFHTKRENMLFFGPVPGGFGATNYYFSNLPGYVVNRGLELSFLAEIVQKKNFNWNISLNMTFVKNTLHNLKRIVNTGSVNGQGLTGAFAQTFADNYPLFAWKMPEFTGYDKNGMNSYSPGGDKLLGSALPTFFAGMTHNFTYKNWSLSIFFNTSRGFYVYNNTANALFQKGSLKTGRNVPKSYAYTNENPLNPTAVSSRFLEKGDFIRLSNLSLNYNFRFTKSFFKSMNAGITGQNLWLITNYSGLDPEVNINAQMSGVPSRGFDYVGYPKAKTVTLSLSISF